MGMKAITHEEFLAYERIRRSFGDYNMMIEQRNAAAAAGLNTKTLSLKYGDGDQAP